MCLLSYIKENIFLTTFSVRWVRFEEDVEEGGQRWSKPRVSTLSLHSFFELRSFILNGTIALDVEGGTVEEIFNNVFSNIVGRGRLTVEKIQQVRIITSLFSYSFLFLVRKVK